MISPKRGLSPLNVVSLGCQDYEIVLREMRRFTDERDAETEDELWLLEHPPVFTQGQAGKAEHLLDSADIPVVQSDRGGQITYHGPGQLVAYPLLNLRRLGVGVRELVSIIEKSVVTFLSEYRINSAPKSDAPGVYVEGRKIASLGLRVRKGCSFHGVAINISLDLTPFRQINPCGYAELEMVRLADLTDSIATVDAVKIRYAELLAEALGLQANFSTALPEWSR